MDLSNRINTLLPESASSFERAQAKVVTTTSMVLGFAVLALVLYWVVTNTLEHLETVFIAIGLALIFMGIVALVKRGYIKTGAWLITGLMLFLNLANMAVYGIGSTASTGYIISILLAVFSLGPKTGMGITVLGCISVFSFAYFASTGQLPTEIPYQISNLSFDAPTLSLIYLITGVLSSSWVASTREGFAK